MVEEEAVMPPFLVLSIKSISPLRNPDELRFCLLFPVFISGNVL